MHLEGFEQRSDTKSDTVFKTPWLLCCELPVGEGWGWDGRSQGAHLGGYSSSGEMMEVWIHVVAWVRFWMFQRQNQQALQTH